MPTTPIVTSPSGIEPVNDIVPYVEVWRRGVARHIEMFEGLRCPALRHDIAAAVPVAGISLFALQNRAILAVRSRVMSQRHSSTLGCTPRLVSSAHGMLRGFGLQFSRPTPAWHGLRSFRSSVSSLRNCRIASINEALSQFRTRNPDRRVQREFLDRIGDMGSLVSPRRSLAIISR